MGCLDEATNYHQRLHGADLILVCLHTRTSVGLPIGKASLDSPCDQDSGTHRVVASRITAFDHIP